MNENPENNEAVQPSDQQMSDRKSDHINMAFQSRVSQQEIDPRFIYEPILSGHQSDSKFSPNDIGGKVLSHPLWVSSMTGGTQQAKHINQNLAKVVKEFGLGMGLGSCRPLLESKVRWSDFDIRPFIGSQPLYANLGIAQLEELITDNKLDLISEMINGLQADGLIIHVNPLQEWMQPEGDQIKEAPINSIQTLLSKLDIPLMVKEVGQGMGKESLKALLKLPLVAIELAGNGGTNFSKLELLRSDELRKVELAPVVKLGHSAEEMVGWCNELHEEWGAELRCNQLIVSGGIKNFLDGYYLIKKSKIPAIYAQASGFLKYAVQDYDKLKEFVALQIEGLQMSNALLRIRE